MTSLNHKKTLENKDFYSVSEIANFLGVSRVTVFNRIKDGTIDAQKIGRNYAIPKSSLGFIHNTAPLTKEGKFEIEHAVEKVVKEYGAALKMLGKE